MTWTLLNNALEGSFKKSKECVCSHACTLIETGLILFWFCQYLYNHSWISGRKNYVLGSVYTMTVLDRKLAATGREYNFTQTKFQKKSIVEGMVLYCQTKSVRNRCLVIWLLSLELIFSDIIKLLIKNFQYPTKWHSRKKADKYL